MKLSPMRFKSYVWPHNPKTFEVTEKRRLSVNPIPFGRHWVTDMGTDCRVLRGEGEFAGAGAYEEFMRLKAVFDEGTPGVLVHPVWKSVKVWFAELSLIQEPLEDYVRYSFEFVEDGEQGSDNRSVTVVTSGRAEVKTYTVRQGDTMWGIARDHDMELYELIGLNPQIKNPNLIYPGQIIYLSEVGA